MFKGTTIISVRKNGKVAVAGDGQVSFNNTVMKHSAVKVRKMYNGKVLGGFAGSTADAFTLFEKFDSKLEKYRGNLTRAAVELAKDWRTDKVLRRLEALLIVVDKEHSFIISGSGRCYRTGGRYCSNRFRRKLCVGCSEGNAKPYETGCQEDC